MTTAGSVARVNNLELLSNGCGQQNAAFIATRVSRKPAGRSAAREIRVHFVPFARLARDARNGGEAECAPASTFPPAASGAEFRAAEEVIAAFGSNNRNGDAIRVLDRYVPRRFAVHTPAILFVPRVEPAERAAGIVRVWVTAFHRLIVPENDPSVPRSTSKSTDTKPSTSHTTVPMVITASPVAGLTQVLPE